MQRIGLDRVDQPPLRRAHRQRESPEHRAAERQGEQRQERQGRGVRKAIPIRYAEQQMLERAGDGALNDREQAGPGAHADGQHDEGDLARPHAAAQPVDRPQDSIDDGHAGLLRVDGWQPG